MRVSIKKRILKRILFFSAVFLILFGMYLHFFRKPTLIIKQPYLEGKKVQPTKAATFFPYQSESEIGFYKFSLKVPNGWSVRYKYLPIPDSSLHGKVQIEFLSPEIMKEKGSDAMWDEAVKWGGITVNVYSNADAVKAWIQQAYPKDNEKITVKEEGKVGNRTMYSLTSERGIRLPDYVILGDFYTYSIEIISSDEKTKDRIKKDLLPQFKFYF